MPAEDHYDEWHDDLIKHRKVVLTISLGKEPYEGGVLELREKKSVQIVQQVSNTGFGDAILFQLHDLLEHRRTAVLGTTAKTAFAG